MAKDTNTYIGRMEHFITQDMKRLSPSEVKLFLLLFHLNNKSMWAEWFEVGNRILSLFVGLDERNLLRTKKGLKEKGLIDFTPGKRGQPTKYRLFMPGEIDSMSKYTGKNDIETDILTDIETDIETTPQTRMNTGADKPLRHKTKDIRHITPPKGGADDLFQTFYDAYPKKQDKQRAKKIFLKLNPDEELFQRMMAALEAQKASYKASSDWQQSGWKYFKMPSTWLYNARWEDEVQVNPPSHENTIEQRDAERRAQAAAEEAYLKGADASGET